MRKVVIIGAGHVGSHCGYTLAHSGITDEIVLVDVDKDKAYAQALDIADSVSFCERETVVRRCSDCCYSNRRGEKAGADKT